MLEDNKNFQTPENVCKYMVGLIPLGVKTVLEPTPGKGNLVRAIKEAGYAVEYPEGDYWNWKTKHEPEFGCVVANPPFSPAKTGYMYLEHFMLVAQRIIILLPWSTITNSDSRTKEILDFGLVSVTHLPRKTFAGARGNFCILYLHKHVEPKLVTRLYFY